MPAFDRLADEGILFTHTVAASCWTRPTVASVMTGKPTREHRLEERTARLDPSFVTLAEAFRSAGYTTAAFPANPIVRSEYGFDQGFDTYLDSDDFGSMLPAAGLLEHALEWVREHRDENFFLWVFVVDPHDPYQREPGYERIFDDEVEQGPYPIQPPPEVAEPYSPIVQQRIVAAYDASLRYTSDHLGRFLDGLVELGLYDRATIVVSADHGEMLGEHRSYRHLYQFWDQVLRVPLVVRSPALDVRGVAEPRLVSQIDIMPTILGLAGVPVPRGVRGRSILPMLRDPRAPGAPLVLSEMSLFGVRAQVVRDERYKVVVHHGIDEERFARFTKRQLEQIPSLPRGHDRTEVFDLSVDPDEEHDLSAEERGREVAKRLLDAAGPLPVDTRPPNPALDEDLMRDLRALGYAN